MWGGGLVARGADSASSSGMGASVMPLKSREGSVACRAMDPARVGESGPCHLGRLASGSLAAASAKPRRRLVPPALLGPVC